MTESKHFLGFNARTWWTLVIAFAVACLVSGGTAWIVVDYVNAKDHRNQEHSNQQFRHALLQSNEKFRQALRISTAQSAYAQNKAACGFRKIAVDGIARADKILSDETATHASRVAAEAAKTQAKGFLSTQITVPPDFDCSKLPKRPPK